MTIILSRMKYQLSEHMSKRPILTQILFQILYCTFLIMNKLIFRFTSKRQFIFNISNQKQQDHYTNKSDIDFSALIGNE
jgi:hypothetical protein